MRKSTAALLLCLCLTGCSAVEDNAVPAGGDIETVSAVPTETVSDTADYVSETSFTETFGESETSEMTEETSISLTESETSEMTEETSISLTESETPDITEETSISETETAVTEETTAAEIETSTVSHTETASGGPTYIDGILIANKTYALPADYNPGVQPEAEAAFKEMQAAAWSEGLNIWIASGFRSYDYQSGLYERYVKRSGKAEADRYSARPGHSEHQTGLAFDLNSIDDSFADTAEGKWVAEHCHEYGFIIRYPKGAEDITGYIYEPWHIRYLGRETAERVHNSGLTLEEYLGITSVYAEKEDLYGPE